MASIASESNGRKRLLFVRSDGVRKTIRLGKLNKKQAEAFKVKVEQLLSASITGCLDEDTARWMAGLDDQMHARLSSAGLTPERRSLQLGPWLEKHLADCANLKPESLRKLTQTKDKLLGFFDATTPLRSITHDQASDWRRWLMDQGLSEATVKTHCGNAKTMLEPARKLIGKSPFEHLKSGSTASNNDRYVTPEETDAILAACPDIEWKLLFGLARLAGLRIPSESHLLTWANIDWKNRRLNVRSPKTEHHPGHEQRTVPIMPKLMAILNEAYGVGKPVNEHLLTMRGSGHIWTTMREITERAGAKPWPALFQTCRSSCEIEWAMAFPQFAVSKWIGHSITVSGKHYANRIPLELLARATAPADQGAQGVAQNPAQHLTAEPRIASQAEILQKTEVRTSLQGLATYRKSLQDKELEAGGIEPPSRDCSNGGLYMHSRCFNLEDRVGHRQSARSSSRLCLIP